MGVFLSKPCVAKFSEDGQDESTSYGVSSMQGWRKNMEDAHIVLLDVPSRMSESEVAGDTAKKIRMFGVFDGHGGKDVALFVQEHLAEELVKLDDFKGGNFPQALISSFHRMDELLEGAAVELRRAEDRGGGSHGAATVTGMIKEEFGQAKRDERKGSPVGAGRAEDGTNNTQCVSAGGFDQGAVGVERSKAIVEELKEFRSRKNPSEGEVEPPSPPADDEALRAGASLVGSTLDDSDSDDENESRAMGKRVEVDTSDTSEIRRRSKSQNGSGGAGDGKGGSKKSSNMPKLADALDIFHRILDLRSQSSRSAAIPSAGTARTDDDVAAKDDASPSPLALPKDIASETFSEKGGSTGPDGEGDGANALGAERDEDGDRDGGANDDEGEDTFGDSEPEDDDVTITANGDGVRPRLGLGPSLQSLVHAAGVGPSCTLNEHPIQAGCTSVVCLMVGRTIYVANAGDSRAVLCRHGKAIELSTDHKPMSVREKNRIERAGGYINAAGRVNGNLNLSRSIGDLKYKANAALPPAEQIITAEPDVCSVYTDEEDKFLVLACDGVWDCMTSQECVDFVGARIGKVPLSEVCEDVMDNCLSEDPRRTAGIGGDNMTCIVVLLDKNLGTESVSTESKDQVPETV